MARTLLDLANRLERKIKAIDDAASKNAVDTALAIVGDLAYKTPVDTSQALSNWQVTVDSPASGKIPPHYPGQQGSTQGASAAETLNLAKIALRSKKTGRIIFITNNLRYIRRLNEGYSKQSPAGFVQRAILIGRKMRAKFKIRD